MNDAINDMSLVFDLIGFEKIVYLVFWFFILHSIVRLLSGLVGKLSVSFPSRRLILFQINSVVNFLLYTVGGTYIFYSILRPPKELIIAVGGSAAVAIGFSLKDIASSIIAGFVILFDKPFQVGDRVSYKDIYGEITKIGLRTVRVKTLDDNVVTIPNASFMTEAVASGNAGALDMMIVVDFFVAIDEDLDKIRNLLYEITVTSRYVFLKKPVTIAISEEFIGNRLGIKMAVKAYVLDVVYEKAFQTDLVTRASTIFRERNIRRPVLNVA